MTLKEIRLSKGIKQKFVVDYLNNQGLHTHRSSFSEKESGKRQFTAIEVQLLCVLYGVEISDISLR